MSRQVKPSRRDFVKGAALATGALAGGSCASAFAGEAPAEDQGMPPLPDTVSSVLDMYAPGVVNPDGSYTPAFLIPPEPIADDKIEQTYEADVVVIGMGLAGMCAARAALEEGASVFVIEKQNSWSLHSHQICAVNAQVTKDFGLDIPQEMVDFMIQSEMTAFRDRTSGEIWAYMMRHCGEDFDWYLEKCPNYTVFDPRVPVGETDLDYEAITSICISGLAADAGRVFDVSEERLQAARDAAPYINIFNNPVNPSWDPYTERYPMFPVTLAIEPDQTLVGKYTAQYVEENADVHYACWAQQLTTDAEGNVTGVVFSDIDDKYYKVTAKNGVIMATGSYGGNNAMIDYYCRNGNLFPNPGWVDFDARGNFVDLGEGLAMASWVGAAIDPTDTHTFVNDSPGGALGCDAFLLVDGNGDRFMNEDATGEVLGHKAMRVPGKIMWQIFDDKYPEQVGAMPIGHRQFWKIADSYDEIPVGLFFDPIGIITRDEVERSATFICETIEELAQNMGVDPTRLQATIDRYNALAEAGYDEDFGKRADRLFPVIQPPFYASRVMPPIVRLYYGGIMVDKNMHALREADNQPMRGLYVAGMTVGNRFHGSYPNTAMGQNHSGCICYGRLAGTNAAKGL